MKLKYDFTVNGKAQIVLVHYRSFKVAFLIRIAYMLKQELAIKLQIEAVLFAEKACDARVVINS